MKTPSKTASPKAATDSGMKLRTAVLIEHSGARLPGYLTELQGLTVRVELEGTAEKGDLLRLLLADSPELGPVCGVVLWCRRKPRQDLQKLVLLELDNQHQSSGYWRKSWLAPVIAQVNPALETPLHPPALGPKRKGSAASKTPRPGALEPSEPTKAKGNANVQPSRPSAPVSSQEASRGAGGRSVKVSQPLRPAAVKPIAKAQPVSSSQMLELEKAAPVHPVLEITQEASPAIEAQVPIVQDPPAQVSPDPVVVAVLAAEVGAPDTSHSVMMLEQEHSQTQALAGKADSNTEAEKAAQASNPVAEATSTLAEPILPIDVSQVVEAVTLESPGVSPDHLALDSQKLEQFEAGLDQVPTLAYEGEDDTLPEASVEIEAASDEQLAALLAEAKDRLQRRSRLLERMLSSIKSFALEDGASVVEWRRIGRVFCGYNVDCEAGDERFPVMVSDISPAGVSVEAAWLLKKGATLHLRPPQGIAYKGVGNVHAKVAYSRRVGNRNRTGLVVLDGDLLHTWLGHALRNLGYSRSHLDQRRRYVRAQAHLPVEARGWRGDFVSGYFLDLGRGGALLQSPVSWQLDEQIRMIVGPLGDLPLLYLSGFVLHQEQATGSSNWLVRLRFPEFEPVLRRQLDRYVLALLQVQ